MSNSSPDGATGVTLQNMAHWDSIFRSRGWGRYPPEELVRFVARTFPDQEARSGQAALEVGCGPGANLWYLAREGFQLAAIDGSEHGIALARKRLIAEIPGGAGQAADLKVGNFASLPWSDRAFDLVIDIEALSANTSDVVVTTLAEIHRVLKPGGWFFSKMFGPETSGATSGHILEPGTTANPTEGPLEGVGLIHVFTRDELSRLFSGFAELRLDWVHRSDRNGQYSVFEWLVQARK